MNEHTYRSGAGVKHASREEGRKKRAGSKPKRMTIVAYLRYTLTFVSPNMKMKKG